MRRPYLLTLALLLPSVCAGAAPPKPDFANLPAYLTALNQSQDPEALRIRQRIADGPADLARERAAADKAGLLTRPDQLQRPLPPADQNAAPLYVQLDALRKQKPLHLPMYAQPLNGRYAYTPEQLAAVQKEVDARQDIFTLLHQAADKPQCVFVRDASGPLGMPNVFTNYAGLRESAREINTESLLLAHQGNYPQAVTDQERGFRIAAHAASDGLLVSFLVGSAIDAITLSGMQAILKKAGPDAALDSRAEADILALPPLSLSHALSGETAMTAAEFAAFHRATPAELAQAFPQGSLFAGSTPAPASARFTPAEQLEVSNLVDAAQADYLHQLRQLVAAADKPSAMRHAVFGYNQVRVQANQDDPIEALSDLLNPIAAFDVAAASPSAGKVEQLADQVTARRLVTAAGAAVLAVKAQTGAFPSSLPPRFTDPFTSKPLGYRLEGANGFVVYSAGSTGTFDGGKPGDNRYGPNIVFRYPLVPVPVPVGMLK